MAAGRQQQFPGQMRVDAPHLRALESGIQADFDVLVGQMLAGGRPLIVKGFETSGTVGSPATSLRLVVAGSEIAHPLATDSGTILRVPSTRSNETLNAANVRVSGSFTASAVNYIGIDLRRTADATTADVVQFLDPTLAKENAQSIPLAKTFDYVISISTQDFSTTPTIAPLVKVTTDASYNITVIEDARSMFFRLGSGGSITNTENIYSWPAGRTEAGNNSDFHVADKAIPSLKDWMDAVMTRLWEVGGGERWYATTSDKNVKLLRTGPPMASSDWFTWNSGTSTLTWQGLRLAFANSTATYNTVTDNASVGLVLNDGECIYVDVDRSANAAVLTAAKAALNALGVPVPAVPGSRYVLAWRSGSTVHSRDSVFPVGTTIPPATPSGLGTVQLFSASPTPSTPLVPVTNAAGQVNGNGMQRVTSGVMTFGDGTLTTQISSVGQSIGSAAGQGAHDFADAINRVANPSRYVVEFLAQDAGLGGLAQVAGITNYGAVDLAEVPTTVTPATPASGRAKLYFTNNGLSTPNKRQQLNVMWSDGTITTIAEGPAH